MSGWRRTASSPEESGRLLTAFLERFFERYVSYDFTAELEEELDDISGGRARVAEGARSLLARLQAEDRRGDGAASRPRSPPRSTNSSRPGCSPTKATAPTRASARLAARAGWRCAAGEFGAFVACSNYPGMPLHPPLRPGRRRGRRRAGRRARHAIPRPARKSSARAGPLRRLCRARRGQGGEARVDPQGCAASSIWSWRAAAVAAAHGRRRIRKRASRSPPRSAATARISPMTANMRSSARPPRCSRPA